MNPVRYGELVRHAGSEGLHDALELSILALGYGHSLHVHTEGLRGTGKTTVIRAAAPLLPPLVRLRGCPYNCDPARPHCPLHRDLEPAALEALGTETVPTPFLEISPSAKIGTVVGSIDLGRLMDPAHPEAALLPGTLARAHRGVVFVDEINRLADSSPELADALLDVMGTKPGRLQIEETGLPPVVLPLGVTVWAASNPDEEPGPLGDIRRQLSDRFDLLVAVRRPTEPETVLAVLQRTTAEEFSPGEPDAGQERQAQRPRMVAALPEALQETVARCYCDFQIESLRAVQAWQLAARLDAMRHGRAAAEVEDLRRTAPLALRHRLQPEELARLLDRLEGAEDSAAPASLALAAAVASAPPDAVPPAPAAPRRSPRWLPWSRAGAGEPGGGPRAPAGGGGSGASGGGGLAQQEDLWAGPVLTPRQPARVVPELLPHEIWRPSLPGGGEGD